MKNNSQNKTKCLKSAWLIQWECHGQNENKCLKQFGIKEKIVDILSTRKDFDKVVEIAKDIYRKERASLSEKIYFAAYKNGWECEKEFFNMVPLFTHYQCGLYRNLIRSIEENGLENEKTRKLQEKWVKYPQYVVIGHNPYLEIIKVFNLSVQSNNLTKEILEWDRPLADGSLKREKYEHKN